MSRIEDRFQQLRERGEGGLIVFTVAGDPKPELGLKVLQAIAAGGADIIELGIPFSDPLADGPVIQEASQRALAAGVTVQRALELARDFKATSHVPLVFMTCYNIMYQYGLEQFAQACAFAGVDGVITTDLPPEEAEEWVGAARKHGVDTIFLVAPNSPIARVREAVARTTGFVYCVSRMGVTGARQDLPADLQAFIARVQNETTKPVAVGFGVSLPEHVAQICRIADGAIVGSSLVALIAAEQKSEELTSVITAFVGTLKSATTT
jgi:tryptophan synthase alpha chain